MWLLRRALARYIQWSFLSLGERFRTEAQAERTWQSSVVTPSKGNQRIQKRHTRFLRVPVQCKNTFPNSKGALHERILQCIVRNTNRVAPGSQAPSGPSFFPPNGSQTAWELLNVHLDCRVFATTRVLLGRCCKNVVFAVGVHEGQKLLVVCVWHLLAKEPGSCLVRKFERRVAKQN